MKELEENITPSNIGGMGEISLPTETETGSGDVPSGTKKKKKNKKLNKMFKSFENYVSHLNEQVSNEIEIETTAMLLEAKRAGLSKKETLKVAQKFAAALTKLDGMEYTVSSDYEEDSFDLDIDGDEYAGGSYNINDDGSVVNMATWNRKTNVSPTYGNMDDDIKTIIKTIKNLKESIANEQMDLEDELANDEFGMDFDQLGSKEKDWVRDEMENTKVTEAKVKVTKKDIKDIEDSGNIDIAYKKAMTLLKSLSESVVNEANGQTIKEFGDLLALLLDEDSGLDIERAIIEMDPKKARVLQKQISTLYKKLFDLTNDGFNLREDNSIVNEAVSKATKIYQIATPAPQSQLVLDLEELFSVYTGTDHRSIVTEFKEDEGYESVLMFNLSKSDIKKIEDSIADVLIWEYSIKKGKTITESIVTEASASFSQMKKDSKTKEYKEVSQAINNAEEVADIWNMLDPKMFKFTESEFEDIFDDWWNNISRYDSVADFSRNAYWEDAHSLYLHLLPYVSESVVTESFVAYTENSKGEYEVVKILKDQRAAKAWRKKNAYLLDDDSVDVKSIGTTPKKDWDKTHPELATESMITEAKSEAPDSLLKFMNDEQDEGQDANVHLATFDGSSMEAQSTTKTWDDGVPVTKYFTRGGYKPVSPKGEIWILESERFWYFRYKGVWYAVKIADYGTPPFEY